MFIEEPALPSSGLWQKVWSGETILSLWQKPLSGKGPGSEQTHLGGVTCIPGGNLKGFRCFCSS